jgi:hypothetical protein
MAANSSGKLQTVHNSSRRLLLEVRAKKIFKTPSKTPINSHVKP